MVEQRPRGLAHQVRRLTILRPNPRLNLRLDSRDELALGACPEQPACHSATLNTRNPSFPKMSVTFTAIVRSPLPPVYACSAVVTSSRFFFVRNACQSLRKMRPS